MQSLAWAEVLRCLWHGDIRIISGRRKQHMSNAAHAIASLKALEDEAMAAHKRVAEALEGCRVLLIGAIVERYGKTYKITALREYRGIVHASGVRFYPRENMAGSRGYDLNDFRSCKILKYPEDGDAPIKTLTPQRARYNWPASTSASR